MAAASDCDPVVPVLARNTELLLTISRDLRITVLAADFNSIWMENPGTYLNVPCNITVHSRTNAFGQMAWSTQFVAFSGATWEPRLIVRAMRKLYDKQLASRKSNVSLLDIWEKVS